MTKGLEVDMKQEALKTFIDGGFNRKIKLYPNTLLSLLKNNV